MKKLRRVSEAEIIAEFLRNEFHEPEFDRDRAAFARLVAAPDLENDAENAVRRALLFRRRGHMWRELPPDTEWWELQLEPADLARIRVFPRAHWRRFARGGSFYIADVVQQIQARMAQAAPRERRFAEKLRGIGAALTTDRARSTVMLMGVDEARPLTILEGNHRLTAALLRSPHLAVTRFRVVGAFSPRMTENCWYRTNLPNLLRYARNRVRNLIDREADVYRVLATERAAPARAALEPQPAHRHSNETA